MVLTFDKVLAHVLALAGLFICDIRILIYDNGNAKGDQKEEG